MEDVEKFIITKQSEGVVDTMKNASVNIKKAISDRGEPRALVLDPGKLFYRTTEKGIRKPTRITFQTLRRMSKAVPVARLCINKLLGQLNQRREKNRQIKNIVD